MKILLLMKDNCEFDGYGLFDGSVAGLRHRIYDEVVILQEKTGKTHRIKEDQIKFLGTVFRGFEMVVINNLEEGNADSPKSGVEDCEDDTKEDEDGTVD